MKNLILVAIVCLTAQWAVAAEFIPIPNGYKAYGISDDGTVVNGKIYNTSTEEAFRWTLSGGTVGLGTLPGHVISGSGFWGLQMLSGDGSTLVGYSLDQISPGKAIVYTEGEGMVSISVNDPNIRTTASEISHDGNFVIGTLRHEDPVSGDTLSYEPFRWTKSGGLVGLGNIPGHDRTFASDITSDGSVIVGTSRSQSSSISEIYKWTEATGMVGIGVTGVESTVKASDNADVIAGTKLVSSQTYKEAFYWKPETGVVGLGWIPGTEGEDGTVESQVRNITLDGKYIIGWSGVSGFDATGFIWTEETGMVDFQQSLIDDGIFTNELDGWNIFALQGISPNGQYFTGYGYGPSGEWEAWVIRLDVPWGAPLPKADFNSDFRVDAGDLAIWESFVGAPNPFGTPVHEFGDADEDTDIDGNDFLIWQQEFGYGLAASVASTSIPEPTAWIMLMLGMTAIAAGHRGTHARAPFARSS